MNNIVTYGIIMQVGHAIPQAVEGNGGQGGHTDVVLLILYVLLALVFSFLCSVAEAVLLSVTPSYIGGLHKKKPKLAARLKRLKVEHVDRSLAAILTLNTIAHTVGAIGSGAKATAVFGSAWFGVFSAVMTLLILFLSEIIPKTLGAKYWRSLSGSIAYLVQILIYILFPLIWISEKLTRLIGEGHHANRFNRDEFVAMAGIGAEQGRLNARESRIIQNLFRLDAIRARDIMTPRTVMIALQQDLSVHQALEEADTFSRMPLFGVNLDDIKQFILRDDLLLARAQGQDKTLIQELGRDLRAVPSELNLSQLLECFLKDRNKMALVVDEFGGTLGLVTIEDVIETLLGIEIVDETDRVEDMQVLARQKWMERARTLGLNVDQVDPESDS